jgi:hypothetical protein
MEASMTLAPTSSASVMRGDQPRRISMRWIWSRSGAIGLRRRARRRTVTVNTSISIRPTTHSMTGGGTKLTGRCVSSTENQAIE